MHWSSNWTTGSDKFNSVSWCQGNLSAGGMIVPADATKWGIVVWNPAVTGPRAPVFRSANPKIPLELQQKSRVMVQSVPMLQLHDSSVPRMILTGEVMLQFLVTANVV